MNSKKIVRFALLLAVALLLNYIEHLVILPFMFPGAKLGLANCLALLILYLFGKKDFLLFNFLRILLSALLFQGFTSSFLISLGGFALSSIMVLLIASYFKCSVYGLCISSSVMHGLGQVFVVCLLYQTFKMASYLLYLSIATLITGLLMAILTKEILKRFKNI